VYQEPHLAWQFVQARELVEGRNIPAERFVHQFFESRAVVDRLKTKFSKEIKVDVLLKNTDGSSGRYLANVASLKSAVPIHYTEDQVTTMLPRPPEALAMFEFLRPAPSPELVETTKLSAFVRDASSSEKKQVYKRVIEKATAEQKEVLRVVESTKASKGA